MSRYADEQYSVYDEQLRSAAKAHECAACGLPIRKGDRYTSVHLAFDGRAETIKRCARCQFLHEHLRSLSDDMWPDERLDCGESYESHWGETPGFIAALAFWQPGEALPALTPCYRLNRHHKSCWQGHYRHSAPTLAGLPPRDHPGHREPCS